MDDIDLYNKHLYMLKMAHQILMERAPTPAKRQYIKGIIEGLKLASESLHSAREVCLESTFEAMAKRIDESQLAAPKGKS